MARVKFSGAHVWARVEGSGSRARPQRLPSGPDGGEITSLELPDIGDGIRATRRIGSVESDDSSSPIEAPITGEVLDVNAEALDNPDLVNSDPYSGGWLLRVRIDEPQELDDLINEEEYAELTTDV